MYTATEDRITVLTVSESISIPKIWSFMFVLTLVQSHIYVDTVWPALPPVCNSRLIFWSHTMKVLGSPVTYVVRTSCGVVILRDIYLNMKTRSRMFAVNVQSVSTEQMYWSVIRLYTQTSNHIAVVCVTTASQINVQWNNISRNVLMTLGWRISYNL